jgi:hypothetical protein
MKVTKVLISALALFTIAGCKTVDIKDGRVPSQYLSQAKKLEGSYRGEFNGVPGSLVISFNGNKPVLEYHNSRGDDLLNNHCHSTFGDLLKVTLKGDNKNPSVSSALFNFDAAACHLMVHGREIALSFKQTNSGMRVDLTLLQDIRERQVCNWYPGAPPHVPPSQQCTWQQEPFYLYGRFVR